ncbi:ATP-binding protein [Pseudodesulfovibrio sp.]|nr:ATP-binding protein [Pseudodesulfovibrio sp.]
MIKRFVLDGPPGSGKTTVLFGISDGDSTGDFGQTMQGLGYNCIHESVAQAHEILKAQGIDFNKDKEAWLRTIVEIDREKFHKAAPGVNFYDRSLHHWKMLSEASGVPLPDWYEEENARVRYDDPVFIVAPVESMDLYAPDILPSRRFTWEQRVEMFGRTKAMYADRGYRVVEVPMFIDGDIEENNKRRIEHILSHITV